MSIVVSILSSARNEKNIDIGQQIFDRMMLKFDGTISSDALASAIVLLANAYALSGDYQKASLIRQRIKNYVLRKKVGYSWTVIDNKIFVESIVTNLN